MSEPVFHVELRQFPHVARAFNLTRDEMEARFAAPWRAGRPVELEDRRWDPDRARLTVYEGRALATDEIGLGRGWANATRTGRDATAELLAEPSPVDAFVAELPDRESLPNLIARASARYPQARVSERVALVEQAVWRLLHHGARLTRAGAPVARDQWPAVLLAWEAWSDPDLWLERGSGDDVGDQTRAL